MDENDNASFCNRSNSGTIGLYPRRKIKLHWFNASASGSNRTVYQIHTFEEKKWGDWDEKDKSKFDVAMSLGDEAKKLKEIR